MNPVMFSRIGENTLHIFGAINFLAIPMIYALCPETSNRTLEEMDLLFDSKSPWVWDSEAHFQKLKAEKLELSHVGGSGRNTTPDVRDEKEKM